MAKISTLLINFSSKDLYTRQVSGDGVSDKSIVFITDSTPANRDIITHGVSMVASIPRIVSYSVNNGTQYGSTSGAANINFNNGTGISTTCDQKGVSINLDVPVYKGSGESSVLVNSNSNIASGNKSVALGDGVSATHDNEVAIGKYNASHSSTDNVSTDGNTGNTVCSVGNGTGTSARKNLFEIMDNGDIYIMFKGEYRKLQTLLDDSFTINSDTLNIVSDGK